MQDPKEGVDDLYSTRANQVESLASRLEEAWQQQGRAVDLGTILPPAGDPLRMQALIELIKVDMECRWRRGQSVVLDYYLEKYPELGPKRSLPAPLIFEEYRVRQLFGDKPTLTLYQQRFPAQFEEVQRLVREQPMPTVAQVSEAVTKPEAPSPPSKPPARLKDSVQMGGGIQILERLGAGAFGEVYKAETSGGIYKAVKVIFRPLEHDEAKQELKSLELIKSLRHHFLLPTHSFWPLEDRLYILMDLADCTLRERLKQCVKEGKPGIPEAELIKYMLQAGEALDYLHSKGVQHRDIKPENILLCDGNVRVADFGLARHQATRRLHSGSGAGTPIYMPPEAWHDKMHANSDQYSLAATYFELRLGRRLYQVEGLPSLMAAHLTGKPNLGGLPDAERKVVLQAVAKEPEQRYPSCLQFAEALARAVAPTLPPGTFPNLGGETTTIRDDKRGARERAIMITAIASVLVLAAVLWALFGRAGDLELESPPQLVQAAVHETTKLPVSFTRNGITGPLTVTFTGDDRDLEILEVTSDASTAEIAIKVPSTATLGDRELPFRATAGSRSVEWKLPLRVMPLRTLPPRCAAGTFVPVGTEIESLGGRAYYRKIECRLDQVPQVAVRFVFIPWDSPGKRPFYMSENKVSNEIYERFAEAQPEAVNGSRWRLGAQGKPIFDSQEDSFARLYPAASLVAFVPFQINLAALHAALDCEQRPQELSFLEGWPQPNDLGAREKTWPVLRVDIQEAHRCAAWLGGWLPSSEEWDKAAGRFEPNVGDGPYLKDYGEGDIGIGRNGQLDQATGKLRFGPLPVGTAAKDISVFGCRDMAGNGLEWTRTVRIDFETTFFVGDTSKIGILATVPLRGRAFTHEFPLTFSDLENRILDLQFWRGNRVPGSEPVLGFRVALPLAN